MKQKKRGKISPKSKRAPILFWSLLLFLGLGVTLFAAGNQWLIRSSAQAGGIIILQPNPEIAKPNLQLQTFPFITIPVPRPTTPLKSAVPPTQTPVMKPPIGGYCALDDIVPSDNSCQCLDMNSIACPAPPITGPGIPQCPSDYRIALRLPPGFGDWYCIKLGSPGLTSPPPPPPPPGCFKACIAKPIVYLYPTEITMVDVSVTTPGEIFISDPLYPEGGWQDVEAHPDGTLYYEGKKYKELFYESTVVEKIERPEAGIWIKAKDIEPELRRITTQLGLINGEQEDFLEFWVPVLNNMKSPYIYFSILPPDEKDAVDRLTISPEPDTRIEFIAYFKPFQQTFDIEPLELPQTPPERVGFTEVEWGGTIGE
jgi:hypothetical protein